MHVCSISYSSHSLSLIMLLLQRTQFDVHVPTAELPVIRPLPCLHAAVHVRW